MSFFLKVYLIGLVLFVTGCVTTKDDSKNSESYNVVKEYAGSGPSYFSVSREKFYLNYRSQLKQEQKKGYRGVMTISTTTAVNISGYFSDKPGALRNAVHRALKACPGNCYLFGIDEEIVWDGFENKEKYQYIQDQGEVSVDIYNPEQFEITTGQKVEFERYRDLVTIKMPRVVWAFAISENGVTARSSSYEKAPYRELKETVIRRCRVTSSGAPCVIYAINDEILSE